LIKSLSSLRAIGLALSACLVVGSIAFGSRALADNATSEEANLAAILRHLDAIERLSRASSELEIGSPATRYHFDHARLHADVSRIRKGIEDYLTPSRAQPRDPTALMGQYSREGSDPK
jgi:RAQPRD family integrative conjugative element protein